MPPVILSQFEVRETSSSKLMKASTGKLPNTSGATKSSLVTPII
jgi:hypothetical protein